jgi:polyisoprenoid-binding protein YceI
VKYKIDSGKLVVKARSSVHDTTTVWDKVSGDVLADADTLASAGAQGSFAVDMTAFDAGDWLKNRKLRKDFAMDANPRATFTLTKISDVARDGAKFTATAEGTLHWRGKEVVLVLAGRGTLDAACVTATATFELDIKRLGLTPPKLFMFKVEDEVSVEVSVSGSPA